jgi:hypothetical protein
MHPYRQVRRRYAAARAYLLDKVRLVRYESLSAASFDLACIARYIYSYQATPPPSEQGGFFMPQVGGQSCGDDSVSTIVTLELAR